LLGAHGIIDAETDTVLVPEIKLRQIAVQVLLGAMLVDAHHSALEYRIDLDRVGVGIVANVYHLVVRDRFVASELLPDLAVLGSLVGHKLGFAGNVLAHGRGNIDNANAVHKVNNQAMGDIRLCGQT
jgi:hypothetical protein